jgi:formyltetrahydrofolate-dependent phosphoribosylglycinamide formyltransferase
MEPVRIAFFVSGNGTTFQYLAERLKSERMDAVPALLLSSSEHARALERAAQLHVPSVVLRRRDHDSDDKFTAAMLSILRAHRINFACLAGYMKLVPSEVVKEFNGRMINLHPALLPAFGGEGMYGRHVHEAVIASQAKLSGATIHLVNDEYDRGPIVAQQAVYVCTDDTAESLEQRVHRIEVQLYYSTLLLFVQKRIQISNQRVTILPPPIPND